MKNNYQATIEVLHKWARLGAVIAPVDAPQPVSWAHVKQLFEGARDRLSKDTEDFRELLRRSKDLLVLGDPLDEDFGAHRWLRDEREESYSDWLAWILEQLQKPEIINMILGVISQKHTTGILSVSREPWVPKGDEGEIGRLDLKISFDGQVAIIVEVKMGRADNASTEKQKYYADNYPAASKVIIAHSGDRSKYEGEFNLRKWEDVCVELRRVVSKKTVGQVPTAMILAFVGAIEQNILKFPNHLGERLQNGHGISLEVKNYLQKCIGEEVSNVK